MEPLGRIDVSDLMLDPNNPRLPEEKQGGSQASILEYLDQHDVLLELIDSYLANGFFENEPLLVVPGPGGSWLVVEGNRRAAALMRLLGTEIAQDADLVFDYSDRDVQPAVLESLQKVPAFKLYDKDEVSRYLGFRHISGLKTWGSEAKARYLWLQVEEAASSGVRNPFYVVGRQVGSNSAGVRTAYNAFNLLRGVERLSLDADVAYVKRQKFGVWTRLLGTANVPAYLGVSGDRSDGYEEVRERSEHLIPHRAAEVIGDLKPQGRTRTALLADSRDVTDYSDVLGNPRALKILREYESLTLAMQVVRVGTLGDRLQQITDTIDVLLNEVPRMGTPSPREVRSARELRQLVRTLVGAIEAQVEDEDGDL